MSLGPMWASPPKVRADVVISSSPPHNFRPICRNKHRARVTPRPPHTGESRRGCQSLQSLRLLPSIRVGLGWEEVKEGWKERGLHRTEPPLSPPTPVASFPSKTHHWALAPPTVHTSCPRAPYWPATPYTHSVSSFSQQALSGNPLVPKHLSAGAKTALFTPISSGLNPIPDTEE